MSKAAEPYGVGLAYRYLVHEDFFRLKDLVDLIEIPSCSYIYRRNYMCFDPHFTMLKEALAEFPATAHGINLSIGSVEDADPVILKNTKALLNNFEISVFSDHLTFHKANGIDVRSFLCMPFSEEAAQYTARKYREISKYFGRSFGLENVSYDFESGGNLGEAGFISRVCELTDCHLLIDATNLYNNSYNHSYDPFEFIEKLPMERVRQIHLAGGYFSMGKWVDSHDKKVMPGVWPIYEALLEKTAADIVVIERDSDFRNLSAVEDDLIKAREIFYKHRPLDKPQKPLQKIKIPRLRSVETEQLNLYQKAVVELLTGEPLNKVLEKHNLSQEFKKTLRNINSSHMHILRPKMTGVKKAQSDSMERYRNYELRVWLERGGL